MVAPSADPALAGDFSGGYARFQELLGAGSSQPHCARAQSTAALCAGGAVRVIASATARYARVGFEWRRSASERSAIAGPPYDHARNAR